MREIKFRAWDKKNKLMWKVHSINLFDNSIQLDSDKHQCVNDCLQCKPIKCYAPFYYIKDRIVIMQYTGLKDKQDKEIYGGDIVKCLIVAHSMSWYENYPRPYDCLEIKLKVYEDGEQYNTKNHFGWIGEGWDYVNKDYWDFTLIDLINEYNCEIIGNIYQNPELLK